MKQRAQGTADALPLATFAVVQSEYRKLLEADAGLAEALRRELLGEDPDHIPRSEREQELLEDIESIEKEILCADDEDEQYELEDQLFYLERRLSALWSTSWGRAVVDQAQVLRAQLLQYEGRDSVVLTEVCDGAPA